MTTRESRPGSGTEAANKGSASTPRVTHADDVPEYLSDAWWALPEDERQTAVYIAANRWATIAESPYGWALLDEAICWCQRKTFSEWSSAVAEMVKDRKGRRLGPSHAELKRRRAVLGPNYRTHSGGPVDWGISPVDPVDWETGRPAHREVA